ncbi:MAG: T9SS type A sorting domain-containing protein [Chitinophagaceae bacterium]|nr:T9SS type A sorting domain-containing protein [Chitinophagaceae bacterium]
MLRIRHSILAFIALIVTSPAFSQQIVQGFEGGVIPNGWKTQHVKGQFSWVVTGDNYRTGAYSAYIQAEGLDFDGTGEGENWLITPKVLQVKTGDKLDFWYAAFYQDNSGGSWYDDLEIWVSTTDDALASFTKMATISMKNKPTTFSSYSFSLNSFNNQDIYIAFRSNQKEGVGFYLDDIEVNSKIANDASVTASTLSHDYVYKVGQANSFTATISNLGTNALPANTPVAYRINGGTETIVNTLAPISSGSSGSVTFMAGNAFTLASPGTYQMEVYTKLSGEGNKANDTLKLDLTAQTPIGTYPYFEDFQNPSDWLVNGNNWVFQDALTNGNNTTNIAGPNGMNSKAAFARTYSVTGGRKFELLSPLLDFSAMSKPLVGFYVASALSDNNATYYNNLEVLVSLDGGMTFESTPVLFNKTSGTGGGGRLETVPNPPLSVEFAPENATDWRHEIVDLSHYKGQSNVLVKFKVTSNAGNSVWLDDVNFMDVNPSYYKAEKISAVNQVVTESNLNVSVKMNTLPFIDSLRIAGFDAKPNEETFVVNNSATSNDGTITTPNSLLNRYFTIAYSGNKIERANYDITIDITGLYTVEDPDKFYIVKRSDKSGYWESLPTTRSGNLLTSSGLTNFSDFAIAYYSSTKPVTIVSFSGQVVRESILLSWNTAQESNIDKYEVQKLNGNNWQTIGSINAANGQLHNQYSYYDYNPQAGVNIYRLKVIGTTGDVSYSDMVKVNYAVSLNKVYQNVPNPFTNFTVIRYDLGRKASVDISIFDVTGKKVALLQHGTQQPGNYQVRWEPGNLPSGTYYYRVDIDGEVSTKSMLKLR